MQSFLNPIMVRYKVIRCNHTKCASLLPFVTTKSNEGIRSKFHRTRLLGAHTLRRTDIPLISSGYGSFLLRCVCRTVSAVVVVVARPSAILPHCCFHSFFCRCSKKCFCRSYKTLKVQRCLPVHDVVSFEISNGESGIVASHYCLREEENTRSPVRSRLGSANSTDTCAP